MKYCLLFCLYCLNTMLFSQKNFMSQLHLDSLEIELKRGNYQSAADYADSLLALIDLELFPKEVVEIMHFKARALESQGLFGEGLKVANTALTTFSLRAINDAGLESRLLHRISTIHNRLGNYHAALEAAERAYESARQREEYRDQITLSALMALSSAHYRLYHVEEALHLKQELVDLTKSIYGDEHRHVARAMNNLANTYRDLRQYDKALSILYEVIAMQRRLEGANSPDLSNSTFNIGINLQSTGNYEEAINYLNESTRITSIYAPDHPYLGENHRKIGDCYLNTDNMDSARIHYQLAGKIYAQLPDNHLTLANLHRAYATLHAKQKQFKEALNSIDLALSIAREFLGEKHPRIAGYLGNRVEYLIEMDRLADAKQDAALALDALDFDHQSFDPSHVKAKNHMYQALATQGFVHLQAFHNGQDATELDSALNYYELAIQVFEELRRGIQDEDSRHLIIAQSRKLYEHAIETAYHLSQVRPDEHYGKLAFEFCERSRRSTVLEAILSRQTNRFPGIPSEILERESELQAQINKLNEDYVTQRAKTSPMDTILLQLAGRIAKVENQLFDLLDSIAVNYSAYYNHRYGTSVPSVGYLNGYLQEGEAILEYFEGEQHYYAYSIFPEDFRTIQIEKTPSLLAALEQFINHTSSPDSILFDPLLSIEKLRSVSYHLFEQLIKPLLKGKEVQHLIWIPDGGLSRMAMDVLCTTPVNSEVELRDWSFVFRKYGISYAQNTATWLEQKNLSSSPAKTIACWAPQYDKNQNRNDQTGLHPDESVRSALTPLPSVRNELDGISRLFNADLFEGPHATEQNFREVASGYRILHISAHALINEIIPSLSKFLFTDNGDTLHDNQLTSAEICYLNLPADLAVLSACRTGSGKINQGEGVMSLGRAFAFAGVPATVSSLWQVPDQSTSELIPVFYEGLKNGLPKDLALNHARNHFLDNVSSSELRHPYYWAGFILYGDNVPFQHLHKVNDTWWILGSLFALLIVVLVVRRGVRAWS